MQSAWTLYDSDGYVVKSDETRSDAVRVGEKFKNAKGYIFDGIQPGESYRLVIETNEKTPEKEVKVNLPSLPTTLHSYDYKDNIEQSVKVTEITYKMSGDSLYFYFTGEKLYDAEGNRYSRACEIGWKLYDSENYVVASGVARSDAVQTGEKFRNASDYIYSGIKVGETYKLVLVNVD